MDFTVITANIGNQSNFDLLLTAQYGLSHNAPFNLSLSGSNYCIPGATNCSSYNDRFTSVIFAEINHAPACSSGGYTDYTNMTATLIPGQQYIIKVKTGYKGHRVIGWIDFNKNDEFDNDEGLINITCNTANTEYQQTITIPQNVQPGTYRLRLRTKDGTPVPQPCDSYSYGQTLDYTVIIPEMYARVTNVVAEINSANINVTWNAPNGQSPIGYNIYRNGNRLNLSLLTETNYTEQDLTEEMYVYKVTAVYVGNKESLAEMSNLICRPILCENPTNLEVTLDENTAVITWEAPENIDGELQKYNIYRNEVKIADVAQNIFVYNDENLNNGTYLYQVSASYQHCEESNLTDTVSVTINISNLNTPQETSYIMYPNPANNEIFIKGDGLERVEIYDLQGRKLITNYELRITNENGATINISSLPLGVYLVKIYSQTNKTEVKQLIVIR